MWPHRCVRRIPPRAVKLRGGPNVAAVALANMDVHLCARGLNLVRMRNLAVAAA